MLECEPIIGMVDKSFDDVLAEKRAIYTQIISDALDEAVGDMILTGDRAMVIADAALFTVFLCATKIASETGVEPTDRRGVMGSYWPLEKAIKSDVPQILMQFVDAAKAAASTPEGEIIVKITRFQAENFKKLRVVEIIPGDGAVVPIRGRNAQGKSSVLDAIQAVLGGKSVMPTKPVRSGEDEGAVRLELDGGAIVVRRTFDTEGGGQIIVESGEGARFPSPQKMLDGLYTSVAFDPLAFTREKPEEQARILRALVKLDVDPDVLEGKNRADYDDRRDLNREIKTEEARLSNMPTFDAVPAEKLDETALETRIAEAAAHNAEIETRRARREATEQRIGECNAEVASLLELVETITARIAEATAKLEAADPLPEPIDVAEAQEQLRAARETNRQIAAVQTRKAQEMLVASLTKRADDLTTAMEARRKEIADAFARATMPVEGLSFAEGEVLFNGQPFAQASSAEQLRVSTAIGMAGNPKLRVMLVRDGSLLDEDGERLLAEMAEAQGFQLWVEAVDSSGKVGIVMEDGAVASVDGEDAPEPAPIEKRRKASTEPGSVSPRADGQGEGVSPLDAPSPEPRMAESLFGD